IAIDVLDDRGIEVALAGQQRDDQGAHSVHETPPSLSRRAPSEIVEGVEAFDLMPVGRGRWRRPRRLRIGHSGQRPTIPSTGLLADAYIFLGIRPALHAR